MKPIPEACRESMGDARCLRLLHRIACPGPARCDAYDGIAARRLTTREIVRALRAARRAEGALLARHGIA